MIILLPFMGEEIDAERPGHSSKVTRIRTQAVELPEPTFFT